MNGRQLVLNALTREDVSRLFAAAEQRIIALENSKGSSTAGGTKIVNTTNTIVNETSKTTIQNAPYWRQFMMGGE